MLALGAAVLGGVMLTQSGGPASLSGSLLSRPLHVPPLGPDGRCPASSGSTIRNAFLAGTVLGTGPVRVLLADRGALARGHVELGPRGASGWYALQTLWVAMPGYNGPFIVRAARLGASGPIAVQSGGAGTQAGQIPGPGPLIVPAGPTINTYYTNWRRGHLRDRITGAQVPTLTGSGYRTVPGATWVESPGCYAWQIDGTNFSQTIVMDAQYIDQPQ